MLRSVHGDIARPRGSRAVIERYRDARPAQVIRPVLHGRTVQRNGRGLRPAAEREDIPRRRPSPSAYTASRPCYTILFPLCATRIPPLYTSTSSGNTGASSQHDLGEKYLAFSDSDGYGI